MGNIFLFTQQEIRHYLEALYLQNIKKINNYAIFLYFYTGWVVTIKASQHENVTKHLDKWFLQQQQIFNYDCS